MKDKLSSYCKVCAPSLSSSTSSVAPVFVNRSSLYLSLRSWSINPFSYSSNPISWSIGFPQHPSCFPFFFTGSWIKISLQKGWHFKNIYIFCFFGLNKRKNKRYIYLFIFLKCQPFCKRVYIYIYIYINCIVLYYIYIYNDLWYVMI